MQLNKEINQLVQHYLKFLLRQAGHLTLEQSSTVNTSLLDSTSYHLIYKYFYNREILYTSMSNPILQENQESLKVYRARNQKLFSGKHIIDYQIGYKFAAFLTEQNDLYVCKTSEYFDSVNLKFEVRKHVVSFSTKAKNFFYQTEVGTVFILFYDELKTTSELIEVILPFSQQTPIERMEITYINAIFVIKENEQILERNTGILEQLVNGSEVNDVQQEQKSITDTKKNILVYHIWHLSIDNFEDHKRYKRVVDYPYSESLLDIQPGFNHGYILSHNNQVFELDFNHFLNQGGLNQGHLNVKENEFFKDKHIVKLVTGLYSYFAIERAEIQSIDKWNNEKVQSFMEQIGFYDYINIIKYEKIEGSHLQNLNKNFMIKTLGITEDNLQTKLLTEINKYKQVTYKNQKVYAWGKNESGQLGILPCSVVIKPQKIVLPKLNENELIKTMQISWKYSLILTDQNRIFISDQAPKPKTEKFSYKSGQQREDRNSQFFNTKKPVKIAGKKQKKSGKSQNEQEEIKEEEVDLNQRWINITDRFTILNDKRKYKIFDLSNSQNVLSVLGSCYDNKTLQSIRKINQNSDFNFLNEESNKKKEMKKMQITQNNYEYNDQDEVFQKKKMTKTDVVINRIKWDEKFDANSFTIVYEDRFIGDLEITFNEFLQSEIKVHRIKIFKLNGEVLWDKEKRIDKIQNM